MKKTQFDPKKIIGDGILDLDRQGLCEFIVKLCESVKADAGAGVYRGGVFPENISVDDGGNVAVGAARKEDWDGQELEFLPPELYWNRRPSPASDVYSIGLIMYYALSGGRLPFEDECRDAQLRRMSGQEFEPPRAAGRRLGAIIKKATAFKAAERYQSMDELRAMAESCLKNLYLNGAPSAETIFNKNDDDLSDIERMMVGIIEQEDDKPLPEPEIPAESAKPAPESETAETADASVAVPPAGDEPPVDAPAAQQKPAAPRPPRVPKLYVEKNPELEPVVIKKQPDRGPVVSYTRPSEKERRMAEEVKKRKRRPVAVILVLCAVLVIAAIVFNAIISDINRDMNELNAAAQQTQSAQNGTVPAEPTETIEPRGEEMVVPTDNVDPEDLLPIEPDPEGTPYIPGGGNSSTDSSASSGANAVAGAEPAATSGEGSHRYELYFEDISWTDAQAKCAALGGHLAVANDADEFNKLVELAESQYVTRVWIGGHRVNNAIVWEDDSTSPYEQWAKGEPSYTDSSDGAAEDYVLLWYNRGWYYNDSRNDPCKEFPQWYGGQMSFICEYED